MTKEASADTLLVFLACGVMVLLGMVLERKRTQIDTSAIERQLSVAANEIITLRAENLNLKKLLEE